MKFPIITTIKDPIIQEALKSDNFIVADKGAYHVISYTVNHPETFPEIVDGPTAVMREFRGLIFDAVTGELIRRPFHKFFNLNERAETRDIDFSANHDILEKLDGSMIAPFKTSDGVLRWGTKMGETDVSQQAVEFVAQHPQYIEFAENLIRNGVTPIFEWCSRKQRIVLDYPEDRLVLTALRYMYSGEYYDYESMVTIGKKYNIEVSKSLVKQKTFEEFVPIIRAHEGEEGVVVRFQCGKMLKVKGDWYVKVHKAKDDISKEHNLAALVMEEKIDDLKSILLASDVERIEEFELHVWDALKTAQNNLFSTIFSLRLEGVTKKHFALNLAKLTDKWKHSFIFKALENEESLAEIINLKEFALSYCNKAKDYEELKKGIFKTVPDFTNIVNINT